MKFLLAMLFIGTTALAHEGHHHEVESQEQKAQAAKMDQKQVYLEIQNEYLKSVKGIFDEKCAACHSNDRAAPWYVAIPGIGWLVNSDRSEAKEHLEISKGFPFGGHGNVDEDFEALRDSIEKDTMPTWLYRFFHPSSKLTADEKSLILNWIKTSNQRLKQSKDKGESD